MMLSGGGFIAFAAAKAWCRLVPPSGAVCRSVAIALSSVARVLRLEPHAVGPGQHRARPRVEDVDLELRLARHLGGEPVHRLHRLAPLARAQPRLGREQLAPDGVHDVLGQHAGRGVDEQEDALAAHLEPAQVLAVAVAHERAHVPARHLLALACRPRAASAPSSSDLRSAFSLFDVRARRDGLRLVDRELLLDLPQRLEDARREPLRRGPLLLDLAEAVADLDQPLLPLEHLLLALVDLRLQRLGRCPAAAGPSARPRSCGTGSAPRSRSRCSRAATG